MRPEQLYLTDIVEATDAIARFLTGTDKEKFRRDELRQSAVLQKLIIIGEAAARLPRAFTVQHPETPWADIVAFRNIAIQRKHDFTGTLWDQLDGAIERFRQVLKVRFDIRVEELSLEGLQRKEVWEYPLEALREAVVNALIHRDYTCPADIQIRLEEDHLEVWSPGELPSPLKPEALYGPHSSLPRNPLIAQAFYYANAIERWGTGTTRIVNLCRAQGLPEPEFAHWLGGVRVTFLKDPYTPERLRRLGLNERQSQAVMYVKERGEISNRDYRHLTGVSDETSRQELMALVKQNLLRVEGKGRATKYVLKRSGD